MSDPSHGIQRRLLLEKKPMTNLAIVLSHVQHLVTPWTAERQASLSFTNSWSLLKLTSIESVTLFNHFIVVCMYTYIRGFPGEASGKEPACQCRRCQRCRFTPWIRKVPWEGTNSLQYSYLENPMDRGAWRATVHGVAKEWDVIEPLSRHIHPGVSYPNWP